MIFCRPCGRLLICREVKLMARKKKAMDFSSLDLNLDALGDWGGDEEKAEKEFIRAAKLNLSPVT